MGNAGKEERGEAGEREKRMAGARCILIKALHNM